jgi:Glyoxalase/Bleomycin resistance protein/Dioxygenase superfamily
VSELPRDPEELGVATEPVRGAIASVTAVGAVHLIVADLERSLAYYGRGVGLAVVDREAGHARIGVGERVLVVLEEQPGARAAPGYRNKRKQKRTSVRAAHRSEASAIALRQSVRDDRESNGRGRVSRGLMIVRRSVTGSQTGSKVRASEHN